MSQADQIFQTTKNEENFSKGGLSSHKKSLNLDNGYEDLDLMISKTVHGLEDSLTESSSFCNFQVWKVKQKS